MKRFTAAVLLFFLVIAVTTSAAGEATQTWPAWQGAERSQAERVVFLVGSLSRQEQLTLTTAVAASGHPGLLLFFSEEAAPYLRAFLRDFRPRVVIPIGTFARDQAALEKSLGCKVEAFRDWNHDGNQALWSYLFPRAPRVVLGPAEPRKLLLQAANLAITLRAPLLVNAEEQGLLRDWKTEETYVIGPASGPRAPAGEKRPRLHHLREEEAVADHVLRLRFKRPVRTVVVANAADTHQGAMSNLAPWLAAQKDALLLFTNSKGTNAEAIVRKAFEDPRATPADNVILAGNLVALPMEKRPNPLEGRDRFIEMEPFTPQGKEPFSLAVGRVFHADPAVVTLMLARPRLFAQDTQPHKALVVANPGGGLPLLETFSRTTAQELRNTGFDVSAVFGSEAKRDDVRRLLPEQTIFLWEGHHSTFARDYEAHTWPEPLRPSLVFLQSCLALVEPEAQPFLCRGAVGVIGSSTRTYSGSGGALSLAYFDSLLYEKESLGGGLRQAKNFLLAFSLLKEKRLGNTQLTGANLRSAWAFSLWGDPTVQLPRPPLPEDAAPAVRHRVQGDSIIITLPGPVPEKVETARYQAQAKANVRLAGLYTRKDGEPHALVPLVFREVALPNTPAGKTPVLRSRLSEQNWVFLWDARRSHGYLLLRPGAQDRGDIRFAIDWREESHGADGTR